MKADNDLLKQLRRVACRLEEDRFVLRHPGLYLLSTLPFEENDFDFTTAVTDDPMAAATDMLAGDAEELLANKSLAVLMKSDRNPWRSRITVGRAANNDVILRHPSVSKLHAYFEQRPGNNGIFELLDPGSANGTTLNARRLGPDVPTAVASGDLVMVGDVECEILDAVSLHRTIRSLFPTPELMRQR